MATKLREHKLPICSLKPSPTQAPAEAQARTARLRAHPPVRIAHGEVERCGSHVPFPSAPRLGQSRRHSGCGLRLVRHLLASSWTNAALQDARADVQL